MDKITPFLQSRGISKCNEGFCQNVPQQVEDLIKLTAAPNINVMEIGFNGGHSAEVFLENNPTLTLTSFDLGYHYYVPIAKEYIDATYPGRHTLILGDSTVTVPKYISENKGKKFDVIFIDGGHHYYVANADVGNSRALATNDTLIILDDTIFRQDWEGPHTLGPTKTWVEHLNNTDTPIVEIARKEYCPGRGMSWGRFTF